MVSLLDPPIRNALLVLRDHFRAVVPLVFLVRSSPDYGNLRWWGEKGSGTVRKKVVLLLAGIDRQMSLCCAPCGIRLNIL